MDCRLMARHGPGWALLALLIPAAPGAAHPHLGAEGHLHAGGDDLLVPGYSVPSFVPWNDDGLTDLVVGEGGGISVEGKIRVYLNVGTVSEPAFASWFYARSLGTDLVVPGGG